MSNRQVSSARVGWAIPLMGFASLLSLVPVLLVAVPGFADVPAHMARHHILAMAPFGGPLSRYYVAEWHWIANLGADLPAALLGRWIGGEAATRIVVALIAPVTIAGVAALSRAAHGRIAASAFVALPFVLGQPWMWGFLNYGLGTGLALLTAAWIFSRRRVTLPGQFGLGLAALGVWSAHMASWVILLLLAAGNELGMMRRPADLLAALRRNAPLLLPLIPLTLWRSQATSAGFTFEYNDYAMSKLSVFIGALRGTWQVLDWALLASVLIVALAALLWAGGRRLEPRLFLAGLLLTLGALAAPITLLNSWGTDVRTAPFALMVLVMAIKPAADPRHERLVCALGLALFAGRVAAITAAWQERSPGLERRLALIDVVPRGGKLGYLYVVPTCGYPWALEPDEKLASYAVPRRQAFVNTLFMVENARLVTIRDPHLQARWSSGSQDVPRHCPAGTLDRVALFQALAELRADRFDAIWIAGVDPRQVPAVPGYAVARRLADDTMLVKSD